MNTVNVDLVEEFAVNIGATYKAAFQICNAPNLQDYQAICHVKPNLNSPKIIDIDVVILNKDTFELVIPYSRFTAAINAGNYIYDVLFYNANHRFYGIGGKIQFNKRVTSL